MHTAVHLGDCPPSYKGVGFKHGTHRQLLYNLENIWLPTKSVALSIVECTGGKRCSRSIWTPTEIRLHLSYLIIVNLTVVLRTCPQNNQDFPPLNPLFDKFSFYVNRIGSSHTR